jgi:hypothetical protein
MKFLTEKKIEKLVKNQILLQLKESKTELEKRQKKISIANKTFFENLEKTVIQEIGTKFYDEISASNYVFYLKRGKSKIKFQINQQHSVEEGDVYYFKIVSDNYFYSSDNVLEINYYVFLGEFCKLIENKKLDGILESCKIEKNELDLKIKKINQEEVSNYISLLKEYLEKIRITEVFKDGNTFEFDYSEIIIYGRSRRYSTYANVLHIVRITPTMCVFKIKRDKTGTDWFSYNKEVTKTITHPDGTKERVKTQESTELIKKKKDFVYRFVKNNSMKLIKTQSRAVKLKNILESEDVEF